MLNDVNQVKGAELHVQKLLRSRYPDDLVRAALSLVELRKKGAAKFSRAHEMWFDRQGLEQSTAELVAAHKATRFSGTVWDLCCGIGSDASAIAQHAQVIAIDQNPAACLRAAWNAEVVGRQNEVAVECRDVIPLDMSGELIHVDPDRRPGGGGRVMRLEDYLPDLSTMQKWMGQARGGAIKLSPASNFGGKFTNVEIELISLHGECKEATIWFGELAGSAPFRASVLPAGQTLSGHPLDYLAERSTVGRWIYDPDPAVVRAGLVDQLAEHLGLARLDEAEEYLTSQQEVHSPFVQTFEVLEVLPNQEREIRHALRRSTFGPLEIKARHIPIAADELRRRLPRGGNDPGVLLFVREQGKAKAVLARRAAISSPQ